MAFQVGTQVRPELGRADVSGFARGGEFIAAGIGAGIKNFIKKKEENQAISDATDVLTEGVKSNQYLRAMLGLSDADVSSEALPAAVRKYVKAMGPDKAMALGAQVNLAVISEAIKDDDISPKTGLDFEKLLTQQNLKVKDGKLYEVRVGPDKLLGRDDPRLQAIAGYEGAKQALYGYDKGVMEYIGSETQDQDEAVPTPSVFEEAFREDEPSMTRDLTFDIGVAGPFAPRGFQGMR